MKKIISREVYTQTCECGTTFEYDVTEIIDNIKIGIKSITKIQRVVCPLCKKKLLVEKKNSKIKINKKPIFAY